MWNGFWYNLWIDCLIDKTSHNEMSISTTTYLIRFHSQHIDQASLLTLISFTPWIQGHYQVLTNRGPDLGKCRSLGDSPVWVVSINSLSLQNTAWWLSTHQLEGFKVYSLENFNFLKTSIMLCIWKAYKTWHRKVFTHEKNITLTTTDLNVLHKAFNKIYKEYCLIISHSSTDIFICFSLNSCFVTMYFLIFLFITK